MAVIGTGSSGSQYLKNAYPVVEGTDAGITAQTDDPVLEPEQSILTQNDLTGLNNGW